jgi:hypothetical protein
MMERRMNGEVVFAGHAHSEHNMHIQIVMDRHGDSRHAFDPTSARSLADAEARFKDLTGKGFRAVAPGTDGQPGRLMREFDATVEETLFIPQLQGG